MSWSHFLCLIPQALLHLSHVITLTLARTAGTVCRAKCLLHHRNPKNEELQTFIALPSSKEHLVPCIREGLDSAQLREAAGAKKRIACCHLLRDSECCQPFLRLPGIMTEGRPRPTAIIASGHCAGFGSTYSFFSVWECKAGT